MPAVQASADAFLDDIVAGRIDAAYARTSTNFRATHNADQFQGLVDQYPALRAHTSRSYAFLNVSQQLGGPVGTVRMTILSSNSSLSFTLVFVQDEDEWKVDRLTVP